MRKPAKTIFQLGIFLSASCMAHAQESTPARPDNLPTPPPLPKEMLERAPSQPPPGLPDPQELITQLKQLEELLSLSPDKLKSLRQTLEFIEKMSLEEREAMRIRLSSITRMTADLKAEINDLAKYVPIPDKANFSQFWLAASDEDRQRMRTTLASLSDPEKINFLTAKIAAFVRHRDKVFQHMKDSLKSKQIDQGIPEN